MRSTYTEDSLKKRCVHVLQSQLNCHVCRMQVFWVFECNIYLEECLLDSSEHKSLKLNRYSHIYNDWLHQVPK